MTRRIAVGALAAVLLLAFQNCSPFAVDSARLAQLSSLGASASAGGILVPDTDKIDANCLTVSSYDACLIRQNPIAASSTVLSTDLPSRRLQLGRKAIFGVKLTSLSGNGKLENQTLSVVALHSPVLTTSATSLKATPSEIGSSNFEQVNTYYWMNRAAEYFDARTNGALPAKGKHIRVVVDDTITGYETATNTIRLKMTDAAGAIAWNGDIGVHLFGVANLMLANPEGWKVLSPVKHTTCSAVANGCCTTNVGCASALRFAVGEYFATSMFPDHTRIGEGLTPTGGAQVINGTTRDISALATTTAAQIFASSSGSAQSMGLLYAALWWRVRLSAGANSAEIDRIFIEHLSLINGTDDFASAIAKAKTVDARLFGSRHAAKFDTELSVRGL